MPRRSALIIGLGVSVLSLALLVAPARTEAAARPCVPATLRCLGERIGVRIGDGYDLGESAAETRLRLREFDAVTLPDFSWSTTEPEPGKFDFSVTDKEVAFAKRNHLYASAYLIWDQIAYHVTPAWVNRIDNPAALRRAILEHIEAFTKRYGSEIKQWTVVNEPLEYFPNPTAMQANHFSAVLGPNWIADAFDIAHEGAPHSSLWLNEVFTEDEPQKAQALVALARTLVDEHVPIDGVSLEGHLITPGLQPVAPDLALVHQTLQELEQLGLQVALSEIDAPTLPSTPDRFVVQADEIGGLVASCLSVPHCVSITFWDIDDARSWLNGLFHTSDTDPTLFNAQLQPKPAFQAVIHDLEAATPPS